MISYQIIYLAELFSSRKRFKDKKEEEEVSPKDGRAA